MASLRSLNTVLTDSTKTQLYLFWEVPAAPVAEYVYNTKRKGGLIPQYLVLYRCTVDFLQKAEDQTLFTARIVVQQLQYLKEQFQQ
jgi:hypothetical protein